MDLLEYLKQVMNAQAKEHRLALAYAQALHAHDHLLDDPNTSQPKRKASYAALTKAAEVLSQHRLETQNLTFAYHTAMIAASERALEAHSYQQPEDVQPARDGQGGDD